MLAIYFMFCYVCTFHKNMYLIFRPGLAEPVNRVRWATVCDDAHPANMRPWANIDLLLGQRRRRWANHVAPC